MTATEIRAALRNAFGARRYRITKTGEVHVFGRMPGTDRDGWFFFGYVGDRDLEARLEPPRIRAA